MACIFTIVMTGVNRYTRSDPYFTLLTSQALVERGTVKLDHYAHSIEPQPLIEKNWHVYYNQYAHRLYYQYPLGNSFLAVPVVAAARCIGYDMTIPSHDESVQMFLAACVCMLAFLLLHLLAMEFMDEWSAFLLALFLSLGTSFMSSLGTAFWSFAFEVNFMLFVLLQMVRSTKDPHYKMPALWMGFMLGASWICRPTAAIFVLAALAWMAWQRPKFFNRLAIGFSIPTLAFLLFSLNEFGQLLPKYYNPSDWEGSSPLLEGLPAVLFSPARGLFVFSPLLLLSLSGFLFAGLRRQPLYLILCGWFLLECAMLGRHASWWGGWSFGPRLLTDVLPALSVMLFWSLKEWKSQEGKFRYKIISSFALVTGGFGIFVHTVQGMYNPLVVNYNDNPNIDFNHSFYTWNWNYPQFLASEKQNQLKHYEFEVERKMQIMVEGLPRFAKVLWGNPDAELRLILDHINEKNLPEFKGIKFYNSIWQMMQDHVKEFYFTQDADNAVRTNPAFVVEEETSTESLGQFLEKHKQHRVCLAVKDEGSTQLSEESRNWLRSRGSRIDSLKFRDSYLAVIENGKLIAEEMKQGEEVYFERWEPAPSIQIRSAGNPAGDAASIKIGGREYSLNSRGFNAVVTEETGHVLAVGRFDTHLLDARVPHFLKARLR